MIRIASILILLSLLSLPVIYILSPPPEKECEPLQFVTRGGGVKIIHYEEPTRDSIFYYLEDLKKQVDSLIIALEEN